MIAKLTRFYHCCLLPELADPCRPRGKVIRKPSYITDAQIPNTNDCFLSYESSCLVGQVPYSPPPFFAAAATLFGSCPFSAQVSPCKSGKHPCKALSRRLLSSADKAFGDVNTKRW
ncbi:hypothetical protein PR048_008515 [Dryococelus australis]|uniref:Uncharacterized protein n=1 Tax=Dryococelus australis TaxID=614101 RepID=A0ABQ9HXC0_9NEOP|nr:hypothetical protein PR048_008515 [Dryococelus australis]